MTLLLHQQRLPEALAQFKEHMKLFRLLPFDAHPAFSATHFGWVVRQYTVMGELMIARADSVTLQVSLHNSMSPEMRTKGSIVLKIH